MSHLESDLGAAKLPFASEEMGEVRRCAIGAALRRARVASMLSTAAIAERTRISRSYIDALEDGQLGQFAAPIYAIGFARSYARAIGLDPAWAEQEMRRYVADNATDWRRSGWMR